MIGRHEPWAEEALKVVVFDAVFRSSTGTTSEFYANGGFSSLPHALPRPTSRCERATPTLLTDSSGEDILKVALKDTQSAQLQMQAIGSLGENVGETLRPMQLRRFVLETR